MSELPIFCRQLALGFEVQLTASEFRGYKQLYSVRHYVTRNIYSWLFWYPKRFILNFIIYTFSKQIVQIVYIYIIRRNNLLYSIYTSSIPKLRSSVWISNFKIRTEPIASKQKSSANTRSFMVKYFSADCLSRIGFDIRCAFYINLKVCLVGRTK